MISVDDLLSLTQLPELGSARIRALVGHFGSSDHLFGATARELAGVPGVTRRLAASLAHALRGRQLSDARSFAARELSRLNFHGGRILTYWDGEYPDLLRKIYDPPLALYLLGSFTAADALPIAIVGTRSPTDYGSSLAESFARELSRAGLTVVSGLARGIDTVAHGAALDGRGRTIAVTGSGLDVIYPPENRRLYARIAAGGAVVTECAMGAKPDAVNFPRRNRIISGLSLGTIVIETDETGGAMITASIALEQNREVFAVPGPVTSRQSRGCHALIRDGRAKLTGSIDDVLSEFSHRLPLPPRQGPRVRKPAADVTLFEEQILRALGEEPVHVDLLAEKSRSSISETLVGLLTLECKGLVKQLPGKRFVRH